MSTVHAPQTAAHAAAASAPGRATAAGQPQAQADLFAQLLADLQADGGDGALIETPQDEPAVAAAHGGKAPPEDGTAAPEASAAVPWLPWAAAPGAAQPAADTAADSEGVVPGADGHPTPSLEQAAPQRQRPALNGLPENSPQTTAQPVPLTARGKGREKADKAGRATQGAAGTPAADAPRPQQAWAALREAATHAGQAHGLRSLVATASADGTPPPASSAAAAAPAPTPVEGGGSGQSPLGGQTGHATAAHAGNAAPGETTAAGSEGAFGLHLQEALQQTLETVGAQVALWQAGRAQHASLSFEDGWDDPLAVNVRLDDGVAHLSFRTDDAAARQLIQAQAPQALAEALARAGLALGQLDVGARGQGDGAAAPARTARRLTLEGTLAGLGERAADAAGVARAVRRGVVDLYA